MNNFGQRSPRVKGLSRTRTLRVFGLPVDDDRQRSPPSKLEKDPSANLKETKNKRVQRHISDLPFASCSINASRLKVRNASKSRADAVKPR